MIEHGLAPARVGARGKDSGRLVENDPVGCRRRGDCLAIHGYRVAGRIDALTRLRNSAVDADATRRHKCLGAAT